MVLVLSLAAPVRAQDPIRPEALRTRLFALAADSMMGRDPGTPGAEQATAYVAAEFKRMGLEPMGDGGGFFQTLPLGRMAPDPTSWLEAGATRLRYGADFLLLGQASLDESLTSTPVVYGGLLDQPEHWPDAERLRGMLVVFGLAPDTPPRGLGAALRDPRLAQAFGVAAVMLERLPPAVVDQIRRGGISMGPPETGSGPLVLILTDTAGRRILGGPIEGRQPGTAGPPLSGRVQIGYRPFAIPARNVVAVLPGRDPTLRGEYVSLTAHNDHVGLTPQAVDHDSLRAYNRVVRPMGADSPERPATNDEQTRIQAIRDSLRALRPPRRDSIFNGADDDGSGTVALLEIAAALARSPERPRRSILFVSHTAEELGLLGSEWFTDHPTVPRESIVAEFDMDMIGRGGADDLPDGGPGYLELIGSRRLSKEFGDSLEAVNARLPAPFTFNYEYDAPGHPLQYYCRADHYSYARYGIPSASLSRGEHLDYHQVTDEPQYIDYQALASVARLVRDAATVIGNMDHRPRIDGPVGDPKAPCRQ